MAEDYAHTAEDWWRIATAHADDFKTYISVSDYVIEPTLIKAVKQQGYPKAASALEDNLGVPMDEAINNLIKARDVRLAWVFQSIWDDAPDSPSIHSWPSWGIFCDLLSESHVLGDGGRVI